ncbi:MAG: hypothetical protein JWP87_5655 [Labilithrix sp.]|nr:hypothetical protein [Labilithrix sp.]
MMHVSRGARFAWLALLFAPVLLSPRPALADEGDVHEPARMDNRARAQQLFDRALADAEAGNLASACPKFLASQEADPKTSTLLNLASCYEKNGQTASAWGAFREAEGLARKVGRSDWETAARTHAEALEPKLVRLTIQVPEASRVQGLTVVRDGARLAAGEWGVAIPVDPGEHVVSATATGRASWETKSEIRDASGSVVVPVLEPLPVPDAVPVVVAPPGDLPPRSDTWWTTWRTAGVVGMGVGVLGVVAGGVLGLVAQSKYDGARGRCADAPRGCPAGAVADADSAYRLATGATVVFVVSAVTIAGGAAMVLFGPADSRSASNKQIAKPAGASASLTVGPGSLGVAGLW